MMRLARRSFNIYIQSAWPLCSNQLSHSKLPRVHRSLDMITGSIGWLTPALLVLSCLPSLALTACTSSCKAFPGTDAWPSPQAWNQLNETIQGRLIRPTPPGAVCHSDQPSYNEEQCPNVAQRWLVYDFHSQDPVSSMWDNWSNFTCLPDPTTPCSGDGYPAFVVNATTVEHVKAGVDFGRT